MIDYLILGFAFVGWLATAALLALAGVKLFRKTKPPLKLYTPEPIVKTRTGRSFRLVRRKGVHAIAVPTEGAGIILLTEESVAPEFRQIIHDFIFTTTETKCVI